MNTKHLIFPKRCIPHLTITGEADIVCSECGRKFGFTYCMDPIRAFVYQKYIRFKPDIKKFVKENAVPPPSVDEYAEMYNELLEYIHSQLVSAFDENMIDDDIEDDVEDYDDELLEDED